MPLSHQTTGHLVTQGEYNDIIDAVNANTTGVATNASAITSEASTRGSAITSEASTRGSADTALTAAIAAVTPLRVFDDTQAVNVSTGETTLFTYDATGKLGANGATIRLRAVGTYAPNGNSKQVRIRFSGGSGTVVCTTGLIYTGGDVLRWEIDVIISRIAANSQRYAGYYSQNPDTFSVPNTNNTLGTTSVTDSGSMSVVVTGQGGASNDIVFEAAWVEVL